MRKSKSEINFLAKETKGREIEIFLRIIVNIKNTMLLKDRINLI